MAVEGVLLTDDDYRAKLENATGVLLFFKKLCPNCKALEKMLEKFFAVDPGIPYLRIDVEESPAAMKDLGVERVPTLLVLKDGRIAAKKMGLMNVREMTEFYRSA
jgi:thioredoxin 1